MDDVTRALVAIESWLALDVGDHSGDPECRYCHEPYARDSVIGRFTSRHSPGCAYRSAVDAYLRTKSRSSLPPGPARWTRGPCSSTAGRAVSRGGGIRPTGPQPKKE